MNPRIRVLMVDDDVKTVTLLGRIISSQGFVVDSAFSGSQAVDMVVKGKYSVVILDFVLHDMRGDRVLDEIRMKDNGVVVVLLTGFQPAITVNQAKFDYVLQKPADPLKVLELLRLVGNKPLAQSIGQV